jgi:hypothetical protein
MNVKCSKCKAIILETDDQTINSTADSYIDSINVIDRTATIHCYVCDNHDTYDFHM